MRQHNRTSGEDTPQAELPSSPCNEAHSHKYLRQESDVSERSFRPQASNSLTKIAIGEKLVTIFSYLRIYYVAHDKINENCYNL